MTRLRSSSTRRRLVTRRSSLLPWACHQERYTCHSNDYTLYPSEPRASQGKAQAHQRVDPGWRATNAKPHNQWIFPTDKRVFQVLYQMCFPYLKLHSSKNFAVDLSKYYLGHTQYLLFCCICCIRDFYPWIININCDHGKHCMIPEQAKQL